MKYLFILGRNVKLSVAEVFAYLKRTGNFIIDYSLNKNGLVVEVKESLEAGAIDFLGGVISIGIVIQEEKDIRKLIKELDKKEIYFGESNKLNYVLWNFSEDSEEIRDYLKHRFRNERLKATEKKLLERMDLQEGEKSGLVSSKKVDEQYFIFDNPAKKVLFGKIIQNCNYSEIEKRDMQKPVRRENLAISPRLAKIMINLSEIKETGKLLDSFCGIGVVLQEGLLQNLEVIGIDKEKEAISGSRQNLEWFQFDRKKYTLINEDSSKIKLREFVDALVSEPDLGETLKKVPTAEQTKKQMREFEELMICVLNNLKTKVNGKIVFSSPLIMTFSKRIGCDIDKIINETSLKLVEGFPIDEFRENQIVGRRIFVLEK